MVCTDLSHLIICDADVCKDIVAGLCCVVHHVGFAEPTNAELVFASMNGALLMSMAVKRDEDRVDDPKTDNWFNVRSFRDEVRHTLASEPCDACRLVTKFLDPSCTPSFGLRVARLGCLLLEGGNTFVQAEFQRIEVQDCKYNSRSDFLLDVQTWLRQLLSSPSQSRTEFAVRLLRFIQLLCEGHNRWWQTELRVQAHCRATVDLVLACSQFFAEHAHCLRNKMPSASKLKSLPKSDLR